MEPAELRAVIADLSTRLSDARSFLDVEGKVAELVELKELASAPDLWDNQDKAREVTRKLARFEGIIGHVADLESSVDDVGVLLELAVDEGDEDSLAEVHSELESLTKEFAVLERESLFFGEYDDRAAILSVSAGAGGVDAHDWAEMIVRMYTRYLERSAFTFDVNEYIEGEEAGIKSVSLTIRGENAYGTFESERGTHRLVRISPFDSQSRRHTAFAGVDVIPEVDVEEVEIETEE